MRLPALQLSTLCLLPLVTLVAAQPPPPPGAGVPPTPGHGGGGGGGDECPNCEQKLVCGACVTTEIPYTSMIPQQEHIWTETKVLCSGAPEVKPCVTPGATGI
ncbi:uncharacterized protein DSM5745_05180 [Aspergillus mulundensis]|uniref:Uncharacterized protein n=1 Tax=Aspergillus mulundensis TaxID=1810919 RepID=A0A3D8S5P0_9EURO|nr:hypothetical protein DSM5745_05180 [Aspergillus mulundensis]RDW81623.1 hypothetical protein DSM5745_05180 [Aspergillus mulundensis]